jgi:hypothetical protein
MKNNEGLKPKEMTKDASIKKLLQGLKHFFLDLLYLARQFINKLTHFDGLIIKKTSCLLTKLFLTQNKKSLKASLNLYNFI